MYQSHCSMHGFAEHRLFFGLMSTELIACRCEHQLSEIAINMNSAASRQHKQCHHSEKPGAQNEFEATLSHGRPRGRRCDKACNPPLGQHYLCTVITINSHAYKPCNTTSKQSRIQCKHFDPSTSLPPMPPMPPRPFPLRHSSLRLPKVA